MTDEVKRRMVVYVYRCGRCGRFFFTNPLAGRSFRGSAEEIEVQLKRMEADAEKEAEVELRVDRLVMGGGSAGEISRSSLVRFCPSCEEKKGSRMFYKALTRAELNALWRDVEARVFSSYSWGEGSWENAVRVVEEKL